MRDANPRHLGYLTSQYANQYATRRTGEQATKSTNKPYAVVKNTGCQEYVITIVRTRLVGVIFDDAVFSCF